MILKRSQLPDHDSDAESFAIRCVEKIVFHDSYGLHQSQSLIVFLSDVGVGCRGTALRTTAYLGTSTL